MAAVSDLIGRRSQGDFDFHVWPQEGKPSAEGKHVLAEVYPAVYPAPSDFGKCDRGDKNQDKNQMDAWKALQWLMSVNDTGEIERFFDVAEQPFGRTANASFLDQIAFEGWILGLKERESTNKSTSTTTPSCGSGSRSP